MSRILIVDDYEDVVQGVSLMMQVFGHETQEALTGHEALRLSMNQAFDAYLLDIGLPDMSGLEVARFIRQLRGETPKILAITGFGNAEMRVKCLDAGFDYHLVKPFNCYAINDLLKHRQG